jgi:hypothetical protein
MNMAKTVVDGVKSSQDDADTDESRKCERFIQEFWDDIESAIQPEQLTISDWRLSFDEHKGCVQLCATAYSNRGAYCNLVADATFFHPRDSDSDTIQRLSRLLGLPNHAVKDRLHKAGLLGGNLVR